MRTSQSRRPSHSMATIALTGPEAMELLLKDYGIAFEREYRFHSDRKWRFDFAIPERHIAIEIEGGTFGNVVVCNHCGLKVGRRGKNGMLTYVREGGRHSRGAGYARDREKYNMAQVLGWRVLCFTTEQVLQSPKECVNYIYLMIKGVS